MQQKNLTIGLGALVIILAICLVVVFAKLPKSSEKESDWSELLKSATYTFILPSGKDAVSEKTLTLSGGSAYTMDGTVCSIVDAKNNEVIAYSSNGSDIGAVAAYCNYGASQTDVFLVTFKNVGNNLQQTGIVNVRQNKALLDRNTTKLVVRSLTIENNEAILVSLVVPESLRYAPSYKQVASEPVILTYTIETNGAIK